MKNLKGITITDLIDMDGGDFDKKIFEIVEKNPKYNAFTKVIEDAIQDLINDKKEYWTKLDSAIAARETVIIDTAYEQGFKTAVKLILSSMTD